MTREEAIDILMDKFTNRMENFCNDSIREVERNDNMTREEAIAELKYSIEMVHFDPLTGETSEWLNEENQRYVDACNMAIKALEQESCEDEYIKVPKKALKYRTADIVAYNVEWLKKHFDIERAVIFGELVESEVMDEQAKI